MTYIHLHNFAIAYECGLNVQADEFFVEEQLMQKEKVERVAWEEAHAQRLAEVEATYEDGFDEAIHLLEGRIKREQLNQSLFESFQEQ